MTQIKISIDCKEWIWKMDYCLKRRIPPAEPWAWRQAEIAYTSRQCLAATVEEWSEHDTD